MNSQSKRKSFIDFLRKIFGIKRSKTHEHDSKGDLMDNENKNTTPTATDSTPVGNTVPTATTANDQVDNKDSATAVKDGNAQGENTQTAANPEENSDATVDNTASYGNGVDINDLVTKDDLAQMMAAFEAKYSAIVKENDDLKAQVSNLQSQNEQIRTKYEDNGDFGGAQAQGVAVDNRATYETFEEYSARFRR